MNAVPEPSSIPSPKFWTRMKVIAIGLIVLALFAGGGSGLYYFSLHPQSGTTNLQCSNRATDYPSCTTCRSGQTLVNGTCYNNCSNTATNPPACNHYPPCTNGGTNPPTCTPPCSNGTENPPQCNKYFTQTEAKCDTTTLITNYTKTDCFAEVISPSGYATGTVGFDCTPVNNQGVGDCILGPSPTCQLLITEVANVSSCQFTIEATGLSLTLSDLYVGDGTHLDSQGFLSFTITQPPSTAKVTGTVTSSNLRYIFSGITFTYQTHIYKGTITSGSYSITLPNFENYTVIVSERSGSSTITCNEGTLDIAVYMGTLTKDYTC